MKTEKLDSQHKSRTTNQQPPQTLAASTAILRRPLVCNLTGKSRSAIYRDIARGLFTAPVPIGGGRVGWPNNEIEALIQARIGGKSDDEIKKLVVELEMARGGKQ